MKLKKEKNSHIISISEILEVVLDIIIEVIDLAISKK